jgi:outer membrane protein
MAGTVLPLMLTGLLQAQDAVPAASPPHVLQAAEVAAPASSGKPGIAMPEATSPQTSSPKNGAAVRGSEGPSTRESRWFVRVGALGALYNSHAVFSSYGTIIPGASAQVTNGATVSLDLGYDVTDNVAVMLTGGYPPQPNVIGNGSIAPIGTLGAVRYGPAILTAVYRFPQWRGLRPYAGGGVVRAFIFRSFDGAVQQLKVDDALGYALQAGAEYRLDRKWALFVDYKRVWLDVNAQGLLAGFPVRGRVTLDPDVVSAGLKFHFR